MSLVIKGGTIVTADRTYKADVLVEGEAIKAIGEGLKGDSSLDASDCYMMDLKANKTITARTQVSVIDYNVFEGTKVRGLPRYALSRGDVVFRDGTVQAELGRGRFVKREPFAADARALKKYKESNAAQGVAR